MKKIKRLLATVAVCAMAFTFAGCGKYATVEEYVNSDAVQAELETALAQLEGSGMQMEVYGEGNKLVYSYTYDVELDVELAAPLLEDAMASESATFEEVAESLKDAVDVENPTVVVEYLNPDGSVIYSAEFTAE